MTLLAHHCYASKDSQAQGDVSSLTYSLFEWWCGITPCFKKRYIRNKRKRRINFRGLETNSGTPTSIEINTSNYPTDVSKRGQKGNAANLPEWALNTYPKASS